MDLPDSLQLTIDNGIATLVLNRPQARNALDVPLLDALPPLLARLADDDAVRVVVITGAGTQAFCAGGDISGMEHGQAFDSSTLAARITRWAQASQLLHTMPKPTVAVLNGVAAGAGMALALACDLRIGTSEARFVTAFARIGMSGDFGGSYFLTRLLGPAKARELYLLSEPIDAATALSLGLLNRLIPAAELPAALEQLLGRLQAVPAATCAHIKANLNLALDADLATVLDAEATAMATLSSSEFTRQATRQVLGKPS